ncbi:MAG: InlB B-repeat-containing protein [Clostridia bacterium]|nr:InlB B-repeat-containing protein [Clostridia bacterium]
MKKAVVCALALLALGFAALSARADTAENMQIVYEYITETLGYNRAAACGIMSNIQYESNFRPNAVGDGGNAYGICQWNSRRQSLINYCERNGFESWQDIYGQLGYLGYELVNNKKKVGAFLSQVPDTPQGAYDAGWYFCVYFEIPANRYEKGIKRGRTAVTRYFTMYGGTYETYAVHFSAQGGSGVPGNQSKIEGVPLTLSSQVPVQPGHVFTGWSPDPDAIVPDYAPGDSYTENRSVTLYAVWSLYTPEELLYRVEDGACVITGYTGQSAQVTVPASIDGIKVERVQAGAFGLLPFPGTVYLPATVTDIEDGAFPSGAMLAAFPGSYAHRWALENGFGCLVVFGPNTFTAGTLLSALGEEAFSGTLITCADLSASRVTDLDASVFAYCPRLRAAALPAGICYIAPGAFPAGTLILAPEGSWAESYARSEGYDFLPLN